MVPIVEAVLAGCPRVRIVVTSRRPLDVRGEHMITVLPLGLPAPGADVDQALDAPPCTCWWNGRRPPGIAPGTPPAGGVSHVAMICWPTSAILSNSGTSEASVTAARAVEVARRTSAERLADALGVLAAVEAAVGERQSAGRAIEEAWALVRTTGSAAAQIAVGSNLAVALVDLGRAAEASGMLAELTPHVNRVLGGSAPDFLLFTQAWAALGSGRAAAALIGFQRGQAGSDQADRLWAEAALGASCAAVALGRPGSTELVRQSVDLARRVGLRLSPGLRREADRALAGAPSARPPGPLAESTDDLARRIHESLRLLS